MRLLLVSAAVLVAAALALVQIGSSAAYGDLAVRASIPAALHALDPDLLRAFVGGTRARAAAALHDGDLASAQALVDELPRDAQADDLRGQIAQARGERNVAIAAFVRAGDVVRAQALIDALATSDAAAALRDQDRLVARLARDPIATEVTGQAWWRLGQLQAQVGYARPAERRVLWREAQDSYQHALASAPYEETYLLAAGYQALANGDAAAASALYRRAVRVVPDSADAYGGLALSAAVAGDCATARIDAARWRALRPAGTPDIVRDVNAGAAARRCGIPPS